MDELPNICERFPLHKAVFNNDLRRVSVLIRSKDINERDVHGNTPLHLAVMLNHKECVYLLLAHGATIKVKNNGGWSPLAEAVSYGDRNIIISIVRKLKQQTRREFDDRKPQLLEALKSLGDFYVEINWDFQSWVPLLSRILPSDTCKISKKGCCIRVDSSLVDFSDMKWQRGDISFIFNGEAKGIHSFCVLDNEAKVFQKLRAEETEEELEEEVDLLMSNDIVSANMSTKPISFCRTQSGWFFKENRTETIGMYVADVYTINGMVLVSKKRREHLTHEDVVKNKVLVDSLSKGNVFIEDVPETNRRESLPKPLNALKMDWYQYCFAKEPPHLGRPQELKEDQRPVKASVALSEEFPLSIDLLLNVLEVIAPIRHFHKLKELITMKLPPGFPVRLELPVFPTITAKVTFSNFKRPPERNITDSLFFIPRDYKENPCRFPDL